MATVTEKYLGGLRVECRHNQSGTTIITDAPTDNNGKGEAFSPTDLCAAALGACAMTIMGIYAEKNKLDLAGAGIEITKIMAQNPRKISRIELVFTMPAGPFTDKEKDGLENAARTCPVALTLGANVEQDFIFKWA